MIGTVQSETGADGVKDSFRATSGEVPRHRSASAVAVQEGQTTRSWSVLGASDPFAGTGVQPAAASPDKTDSRVDRRRHPRFKCEGTVEIRRDGIEASMKARVTDISENGCYAEMQATSPPGAVLNLVVEVNGIRVSVRGTVQVCYPLLGMGIAFTEITPSAQEDLQRVVQSLADGQRPAVPAAATSSGPVLLMVVDAAAALNAITRFFGEYRTLTREKFEELIRQSQERASRR